MSVMPEVEHYSKRIMSDHKLTCSRVSVAVWHHGVQRGAGVPPLEGVLESSLDHTRSLVLPHDAATAILEGKYRILKGGLTRCHPRSLVKT